MAEALRFSLRDLAATQALAERLAPILRAGDALLLRGDLGAGKTAFARALLKALGAQGEIPSPTFTLVQSYDLTRFPAFHFDLYRLKTPQEIEEIGLEDALAEGLVIVEWPEKAESYMPRNALQLVFGLAEGGARSVRLEVSGAWSSRLKEVE